MSEFHFENKVSFSPDAASLFTARSNTVTPTRKLRIVMVGMHLTKTRGGITTLTSGIINSTLATDHDITYIASQAEDFGMMRKVTLAAISLIKFVFLCLVKIPDVVYVHVGSNASLYRESIFILLAKLLRKRTITHFHAGDLELYVARQPSVGKKIISHALGLSDLIIAVSKESARQLNRFTLHPNISVLPNAIDLQPFQSMHRSAKGRDDVVRLLFVGAAGKLKGEHDLIKALRLLRDRGLNFKVDLVGFGTDKLGSECNKAGISQFVGHLGSASMQKRLSFYQRADIFVLPTYAEAMPVSVIEAMAAGLAIVTTPVGGIPELIADGKDGLLVKPGDIRSFSEKIELLINDSKTRLALGTNARRRATSQMDFENYIERLRLSISAVAKYD